jgi:hypothetical protein
MRCGRLRAAETHSERIVHPRISVPGMTDMMIMATPATERDFPKSYFGRVALEDAMGPSKWALAPETPD